MSTKETTPKDVTDADLVLEDSAAADTLHPGAGSGGTMSRAEMLDTFVQLLSQLGKEDLTHFFNDSIAQIGHEADPIPDGASSSNQATIKTKSTVAKEDVDEMFSGDELTEEFKDRAVTVFEAALNTRVNLETARLEEEFEKAALELEEEYNNKLEEEVSNIFENISEKLDQYLDYVVEQWMEENAVAIEGELRANIAEDFIASLGNLFREHYITVPENQMDLVADLQAELAEIKGKLNEVLDEKIELQSVIDEATKESILDEVSEGLVVTHAEKLATLAEGVEYSDPETYRNKLNIIKEQYFNKNSKPSSTGLITEEIGGEDETVKQPTNAPGDMNKYMSAISRAARVAKT